MSKKFLLIVGEKFSKFATTEEVMTFSDLMQEICKKDNIFSTACSALILVPGQGVSDDDIHTAYKAIKESIHSRHFSFDLWLNRPKRADREKSHKVDPKNTLVSQPKKISETEFKLNLLVDENCELLSDHQTGQHLQGMLLLEAARQSFIAVTETYFSPEDGSKYYFIFNDIQAHYYNFAFPVPANINYIVQNSDQKKPQRSHFKVDISVEQYGVNAAEFKLDISAFKDEVMTKKESILAGKIIDQCIISLADEFANQSKS